MHRDIVARTVGQTPFEGNIVTAPFGLLPILLMLGMGGLCIGTEEFASMSLLPDIAATTHVSIANAGGLISAYATGVVVAVISGGRVGRFPTD
ncbi:hypothetical protein [Burkholderia sp. IMCC1007]|uniref:hypothetical protein n=1 Tax=Burkholderia sp. IMCC1007 TaxID=3004104 RepID=UPI0022B3388A|nr:hypothetical protein [Burkholderia sp. IMCC1007]